MEKHSSKALKGWFECDSEEHGKTTAIAETHQFLNTIIRILMVWNGYPRQPMTVEIVRQVTQRVPKTAAEFIFSLNLAAVFLLLATRRTQQLHSTYTQRSPSTEIPNRVKRRIHLGKAKEKATLLFFQLVEVVPKLWVLVK